MPFAASSTDLAAAPPASSSSFGRTRAMARSRKGAQASCSAGVGVRLPGGRQKTVLVMKTRSSRPAAAEHLVEQLAGAADEGRALGVLLGARRLADDHHRRVRRAAREHRLARALRLQRAAVEGGDGRGQRREIRPPRPPGARRLGRSRIGDVRPWRQVGGRRAGRRARPRRGAAPAMPVDGASSSTGRVDAGVGPEGEQAFHGAADRTVMAEVLHARAAGGAPTRLCS